MPDDGDSHSAGGERKTGEPSHAHEELAGEAALVARGSALLLVARIAGNAGFFVAVLILTRALSVPHRGQFAFITTAAQVIASVASLGITEATTVFVARQPERRASLLSNALLVTGLSSAAVSTAFCFGLVGLGEAHRLGVGDADLVLLTVGAVASALASAGHTFLTGCGRWRAQALVTAVSPWLYAVLLALNLTVASLNVERSLAIWVAYYALWALGLLVAATRVTALGRPSRELLRRSLAFGVRAWAGSVTALLNYRTDQLLMGFIASQAALGIYVVAVNTSEILLIFPDAVAVALLPALARSMAESRTERNLRAFRVVSLISLVGMAVAGAFGPLLLPLVFGARYDSAVVPFLWLLAGTVGYVASQVFGKALLATSSPGLNAVAPIASLVLGMGLDFALIPPYGATGAAVAATAAFVTGGLVSFEAYRWRVPFSYRLLIPVRSDLDFIRSAMAHLIRSTRDTLGVTDAPGDA